MREQIMASLKDAMKAGDKLKVETLRMVTSALKNRDIELRAEGKTVSAEEELALLQKLVKSRGESLDMYEKAGRQDLADKEKAEIAIIKAFLPEELGPAETEAAIKAAIAETGAASMKDMGKVIAALRAKYTGRMDFAKVSGLVKAALAG
ncbi:GatB/YqeY domain-containing protein [Methylovirgula sp. 4M-Z18]|uniref:GatB/YqeY domain-containing protein n=1 Tax=Methylovirgula sp. 4M-Z18 TaxID=2293567 RepID=UPI000E2F2884|nr:GatB/YqeY domain-containing protein [Methylovirgula sp. 4M-Z18]RFB80990.1 GatB/YqeY domain-containing protein [Methylovirgula sp. 4M-Z18]